MGMIRGSGVTPAKAMSKVARVTPLARASGHSSCRNAVNAGVTCAGACMPGWVLGWPVAGWAAGLCAGASCAGGRGTDGLTAAFDAGVLCASATAGTSSAANSASTKGRRVMTGSRERNDLAAIWGSDDDEFGMARGIHQGPQFVTPQHILTRTWAQELQIGVSDTWPPP